MKIERNFLFVEGCNIVVLYRMYRQESVFRPRTYDCADVRVRD
jgi:hypothetical protein